MRGDRFQEPSKERLLQCFARGSACSMVDGRALAGATASSTETSTTVDGKRMFKLDRQ